ncbi:uncharacterized protein LOC133710565 isoform X2 [Rosa rugosa]|uniref:uncharacterized protein LOC133710565 isoform X2 n=1 Tax=Rosa rugosa TaxID=74645 RepID=UPI002B4146E5|nr:uncharacterized protein LOC133710565 isoform X2 [Rosa rugosa]
MKRMRLLLLITTSLAPRTILKNGLVIPDLSLFVMSPLLEEMINFFFSRGPFRCNCHDRNRKRKTLRNTKISCQIDAETMSLGTSTMASSD